MADNNEGTSAPAPVAKPDGKRESDNVGSGQASAALFAAFEKEAKAAEQRQQAQPPPPAGGEVQQATTEATPSESPAGEAQNAPAETPPEEAAPAEAPEATQTADEQTEGEDGDVLSPKTSSLDEKTKQRIQKRIDKEVGKRKALEARIAELEARGQTPPPQQQQAQAPETPLQPAYRGEPTGNPLVDQKSTVADLEKLEDLAHQTIGDVQDALDSRLLGPEPDDAVKMADGQTYTRQQLLDLRKSAREVIRLAPKKREAITRFSQSFEAQRRLASAEAHKEFTFLGDKSTPEYQQVQAMMRDPWMQQNPNAEWFTAVYLEGLKALQGKKVAASAKAEEAAKPKPVIRPAAPKPSTDQTAVTATGGPTRTAPDIQARGALQAERTRLEAKGKLTAKDAAELLLKAEQLQRSR